MSKKLAIIGASYLQLPLILRAKEMGIETHVFAWKANDVGETAADFFYPISIIERDNILSKCQEIGIDGICSIASDTAMLTVNYVAEKMGLTGNSMATTEVSTNKHLMRECFKEHGDPSPFSIEVINADLIDPASFEYPVIVKPEDRSGSRGITKVQDPALLLDAIKNAQEQSFNGRALVEEFVDGDEFSVESISWKGVHKILTITKKYTTGSPNFIETAHLEPAFEAGNEIIPKVYDMVQHALNSLGIQYGASHTEFKINSKGELRLIEIGGRMGGDCIGSALVKLSTGVDFVKAVIDVALGQKPDSEITAHNTAAIRYVFTKKDIDVLESIKQDNRIEIIEENRIELPDHDVVDSSTRSGYFIFRSTEREPVVHFVSLPRD
ncbi:MAG: ATP-grasp domain-containing protein [Clostridiales bacterium]|nr:ATP-grasp domain-containing protein [Clostridiales bacterium]